MPDPSSTSPLRPVSAAPSQSPSAAALTQAPRSTRFNLDYTQLPGILFLDSLIGGVRLLLTRTMTPAPVLRLRSPPASAGPNLSGRCPTDVALTSSLHLLQAVLSAAFAGGVFQVVVCQVQDQEEDSRALSLLRISGAVLLATVMAALWQRLCAPMRQRFINDQAMQQQMEMEQAGPRIPGNRIRNRRLVALSILSGGWVWVLLYTLALAAPATRPEIQARLIVVATIQAGLLICNTILDYATTVINRLKGRQESPDTAIGC